MDSDSNYDEVKQGLTDYFNSKKKSSSGSKPKQHPESIDQYATRVRQKAENCKYLEYTVR